MLFSCESVNDGNALQVSLSGFHGNNLSLYMLAIKMLCSMTYVCYSTNRVFFVELYESNVTVFSSTVETWVGTPHSPDRTLFLNLVACHRCFSVLLFFYYTLTTKDTAYYLRMDPIIYFTPHYIWMGILLAKCLQYCLFLFPPPVRAVRM